MSNLENKVGFPELRFPEFINYPKWEEKSFSKLFEIGGGKDHKHLADGDIPVYGSGGYMRSVNDYLYDGKSACIGRKGTINNPMFLTGKFWTVDTLFYTHSFKNCIPEFVYLLFQNIDWLKLNEAGGVPSLSKVIINKIEVLIPKEEEQQKIVDCISSMDDLITTNTKKLELLKFHKKGLMQKLFPEEGKSAPELGFTCNVKWNKKKFEEVYSLKTTNSLSRDKLNYDDGLVKNIHYGDIHTKFSTLFDITKESVPFINAEIALDKVKEESYCQEGDMVFADASEDIDDVGKSIELINLNGEKLLSGLHTILARQKGSYLVKGFGGYLFKSEVLRKQIQKESQGAKVLGISATRISKIDVVYPIEQSEQQRIVDCLSSLDKLIDAQTKKIEILNIYKKGLMQQLFPEIKEAIA